MAGWQRWASSLALAAQLVGCEYISGLADYDAQGGAGGSSSSAGGAGGAPRPGCALAVAAGDGHTCAIRNDRSLWCWGDPRFLGVLPASAQPSPSPMRVDTLGLEVNAIACGNSHSCAIRSDGVLSCWGMNDGGQIGNGEASRTIVYEPAAVSALGASVTAVAVGGPHTCAVNEQGLYCWGWNGSGQLGVGSSDFIAHPEPELVGAIDDAVQPAAGSRHSCVRRQTGAVWCWGANDVGQLGQGTASVLIDTPQPVTMLAAAAFELEAGADHDCARISGALRCWGGNAYSELGAGEVDPGDIAEVDAFNNDVLDVSLGKSHSCAVRTNNKVWCWGANDHGQLGIEGSSLPSEPTEVEALAGIAESVALGASHSCALTSDGHVLCWGSDDKGQLGRGELVGQSPIPAPVALPCP